VGCRFRPGPFSRTFALGYERLDPGDAVGTLARALLARAAYFAPGEPIPRSLLFATTGLSVEDSEAALQFEEALERIVSLGLLESGAEGSFVMHRLVAVFSRQAGAMDGDDPLGTVEETLLWEVRRLNHAGYPAPLSALQSHLIFMADRARGREDERAADLCLSLGYFFYIVVDLVKSRTYFERALVIREKVSGAEHPITATSLNNLGHLLASQRDYSGSRDYYEQALAIQEKVLGTAHPNTALILNNLGYILFSQGDYYGARVYFERALAINEKVLGGEHPDTALSLNNLGYLLSSQEDYSGARGYYERALAIFNARLGPDHPSTKIVRDNLDSLKDK
jgi:tetratricopeptide (TPR) repeat protein